MSSSHGGARLEIARPVRALIVPFRALTVVAIFAIVTAMAGIFNRNGLRRFSFLLLAISVSCLCFGRVAQADISTGFWFASSHRHIADSAANPNNQLFKVATRELRFELRPDLQMSFEDVWLKWLSFLEGAPQVTIRPRWLAYSSSAEQFSQSNMTSELKWIDGFWSVPLTAKLSVTHGLQNYQWGPGEAASPSNRIFRQPVLIRDLFWVVAGQHLLRFNYSPSERWTEVLLVELSDNGSSPFREEEAFEKKIVLKSELAAEGGGDYVGFVVGAHASSPAKAWIGEYFNWEVRDGFYIFADVAHQKGSQAWYPTESAGRVLMAQPFANESRIFTYAVAGLRYAFTSGSDLRGEWIFQEAGYDAKDLSNLNRALAASIFQTQPAQAAVYPTNLARSQKSGLEFPGQKYVLFSWRVPDPDLGLKKLRDVQFYIRHLLSLTDSSSASFLSSEWRAGESGTLLVSGALNSGAKDSELHAVIDSAFTVAYRHVW